ncbi:DUF485 domain-containing protein [Helicobacter didelphidarum]|uniref:DUF485 domain-containing protein n=1 Tax=Helicobacter didelphidarum TaxID=2040648 RepID=A0A3D8ID92_9HELI|nr:DUF485 domain-containing protein [Helicobacter didelphidarum]RDU63112.1 DUF485 domain-containing protein [Helicobacter didelphidarum]
MDYTKLKNTRFMKFIKLRDRIGFALALIVLIVYYVFLIAVGAFPEILGYMVGPSSVSLGLLIGLFIICLCIALTGLYTFMANKFFDKELESSLRELREKKILKDDKIGDEQ